MTGNPAPGYARKPQHRVELSPQGGRVRVLFAGEVIADSRRATLVQETGYGPVHYFPLADVRTDLLRRSDKRTYCPFKGEASYWSLTAGGRTAENAVWSYETPYDECLGLRSMVAFYEDRMDTVEATPG